MATIIHVGESSTEELGAIQTLAQSLPADGFLTTSLRSVEGREICFEPAGNGMIPVSS
jgi:hypothetical protein